MDGLVNRFDSNSGGLYDIDFPKQVGGKKNTDTDIDPDSAQENWRKKYRELEIELENAKRENKILKGQLMEYSTSIRF